MIKFVHSEGLFFIYRIRLFCWWFPIRSYLHFTLHFLYVRYTI